VPPRRLIVQVAGTPDASWFLESGRLAAAAIRGSLGRAGTPLERLGSILDFGCGCGRVTRRWRSLDGTAVHGSDANEGAIAWCRQNLPFASFETNGLEPPLAYPDESFDLVYALSVLTHLPEELQLAWAGELRRILKPGGLLLLSVHGERYRGRLDPGERARFDAGRLVVRWPEGAGTNLCSAFHPRRYVEGTLAAGLAVVDFAEEGAAGNPHHDLYLLRKDS
jgi:SAM-dependent methyltransferase